MLKLNLSFLVLLYFILSIPAFAQETYPTNYEIEYEAVYAKDTTHLEQKSKDKVYLFTGKNHGIFMSRSKAKADEIRKKMIEELGIPADKAGAQIQNWSDYFNKVFYKNYQTQAVETVGFVVLKRYLFKEPKKIQWKIRDSTKTIKEFTAQKATTHFAGRDYIAWFTPEIPIPDGPYIFSGLPGLIVELYDTDDEYHFTMNYLKKLEKPRIWKRKKLKTITKAKFEEMNRKAQKNGANPYTAQFNEVMDKVRAQSGGKMKNMKITVTSVGSDSKGMEVGKTTSLKELTKSLQKNKPVQNNPIERAESVK